MLLMPAHILFLQLIIDPACSVVFEAEPLEADAMKAPPRRQGAKLFDSALVARGLWQGAGLLLMLLIVYAEAAILPKRSGQSSSSIWRAMSTLPLNWPSIWTRLPASVAAVTPSKSVVV